MRHKRLSLVHLLFITLLCLVALCCVPVLASATDGDSSTSIEVPAEGASTQQEQSAENAATNVEEAQESGSDSQADSPVPTGQEAANPSEIKATIKPQTSNLFTYAAGMVAGAVITHFDYYFTVSSVSYALDVEVVSLDEDATLTQNLDAYADSKGSFVTSQTRFKLIFRDKATGQEVGSDFFQNLKAKYPNLTLPKISLTFNPPVDSIVDSSAPAPTWTLMRISGTGNNVTPVSGTTIYKTISNGAHAVNQISIPVDATSQNGEFVLVSTEQGTAPSMETTGGYIWGAYTRPDVSSETSCYLDTGFNVGKEGIYLWPLMDADRYVAAMNANPRRWEDVVMNPQPWVSNGSANYEVTYCADLQQAPYASGTPWSGAGSFYRQRYKDPTSLEDASSAKVANKAAKLKIILANSYPYISVEQANAKLKTMGLAGNYTDKQLAAGSQAALWQTIEGQACNTNNATVNQIRDAYLRMTADSPVAYEFESVTPSASGVTIKLNRTVGAGDTVAFTLTNSRGETKTASVPVGSDTVTISWPNGHATQDSFKVDAAGSRTTFTYYFYEGTVWRLMWSKTKQFYWTDYNASQAQANLAAQNLVNAHTSTAPFEFHYETDQPTGKIQIQKRDATNQNQMLNGAKFALYTDAACTQVYKDNLTTANIVVNGQTYVGGIYLDEVPYGTYYLKEITPPTGYKPLNGIIKIVVDSTTTYTALNTSDPVATQNCICMVGNIKKLQELPQTGSSLGLIATIGGLVLIGISSMYITSKGVKRS